MENLVGHTNPDAIVRRELLEAGIAAYESLREKVALVETALNILRGEPKGFPVFTSVTGILGNFVFTREPQCYTVEGDLPLDIARLLYQDPVGAKEIRVGNYWGGVEPTEHYGEWVMPCGRIVRPKSQEAELVTLVGEETVRDVGTRFCIFSDDPEGAGARCFITNYGIDTPRALQLFANTLRTYGLA